MAEFDGSTTPLDQFCELISETHARKGLFFIDLPANHTGWGSTLQTHHPEWFVKNQDGKFHSPGAWGVKWEDLVELDYAHDGLISYMAEVFLFWCRQGVDGFRCDAGYMIPQKAWRKIVSAVRDQYPDTVFMLEGLGGDLAITDALLSEAGLDWAYSEIFQVYNRDQFEWYLPDALKRSAKYGTLVNFAETHDNDRLAKSGRTYAALRVQLAALLSSQGAWGIANGVEWLATEKIDVHGRNSLNWDSSENLVELISKLNFILSKYESFHGKEDLKLITRGGGNTIAFQRGEDILVAANLDCSNGVAVEFDHDSFIHQESIDLLSERVFDSSKAIDLAPGQVVCLASKKVQIANESCDEESETNVFFKWRYPYDVKRDVVVVEDDYLEISAPCHFMVQLFDPIQEKTIVRAFSNDKNRIVVKVPKYREDGTKTHALKLNMEVYSPDGMLRSESNLCIAPPYNLSLVKPYIAKEEIKERINCRGILSNCISASAQVRSLWGNISSQYDSFLSANPKIDCPSDRLLLWSRTRAWMQVEGFSYEFGATSQTHFEVESTGLFARWYFSVKCALGRSADFIFTLSLAEEENAAMLKIERVKSKGNDMLSPVRVVLRPDIEWRSFHSTTKAFEGPETHFPKSVKTSEDSFVFSPYGDSFVLSMSGKDVSFNHEPQWVYNVPHAEEAERGQTPSGDVFSPGWISVEMPVNSSYVLVGRYAAKDCKNSCNVKMEFPALPNAKLPLRNIKDSLLDAMNLFSVRRDNLKTVLAGFPWFLDWGRDTFIFMRGMIASGMTDSSLQILRAFAAFEERGTLPNIIYGQSAGNRDTVDAQLWFVRCVYEIISAGYPKNKLKDLLRTCKAIVDNYLKGTPNGIKVDERSSLVWAPSHFTWMDTNYPACTARNGYPVEIQALWISALRFVGYGDLAEKALSSVQKLMKSDLGYGDCIDAPNGESAFDGILDKSVRPNQLFLVSLGIVSDESIIEATKSLFIPGSIRSLDARDLKYKGCYTGDEDTMRKWAYHNGTAWAWQMPSFVEAAVMMGLISKKTALSMLSSAVDIINDGALGHICEISDGDAPHTQKGCTAQAWSVSELLRVLLLLA
jgi:predicted glycogen debranching enzyme